MVVGAQGSRLPKRLPPEVTVVHEINDEDVQSPAAAEFEIAPEPKPVEEIASAPSSFGISAFLFAIRAAFGHARVCGIPGNA